MTTQTLDIEVLGVRHSARLLPEFACGSLGIDEKRGRIVVAHFPGGFYKAYHPREVIGWRLACRCERLRKDKPAVKPWTGEQFWDRVDNPSEHAPSEYRVYAPDELTVDAVEIPDVRAAAHSAWVQSHIQSWAALSRVCAAISDLKAAHREYHDAVQGAKNTRLVEPLVVATMGLRPDEVGFLDGLLGGGTDG
jgi:hypothetical protein